jgi:hypothetical protein
MLFCASVYLFSCGKNNQESTPSSKNEIHSNSEETASLLILKTITNSDDNFNVINSVNLKQGENNFDFIYKSDKDNSLNLDKFIGGPLIGCENSDIGIKLNIHHTYSNGAINLESSLGLGYSPTQLIKDENYIIRVKLILKKDCLGLNYKFSIFKD